MPNHNLGVDSIKPRPHTRLRNWTFRYFRHFWFLNPFFPNLCDSNSKKIDSFLGQGPNSINKLKIQSTLTAQWKFLSRCLYAKCQKSVPNPKNGQKGGGTPPLKPSGRVQIWSKMGKKWPLYPWFIPQKGQNWFKINKFIENWASHSEFS